MIIPVSLYQLLSDAEDICVDLYMGPIICQVK